MLSPSASASIAHSETSTPAPTSGGRRGSNGVVHTPAHQEQRSTFAAIHRREESRARVGEVITGLASSRKVASSAASKRGLREEGTNMVHETSGNGAIRFRAGYRRTMRTPRDVASSRTSRVALRVSTISWASRAIWA